MRELRQSPHRCRGQERQVQLLRLPLLAQAGQRHLQAPRLNARTFEKLVVNEIRENVLTESNIKDLVKLLDEEMDGLAREQRQKLQSIEEELEEVKRRLGRIWHAIETTDIEMADASDRIGEHRDRKEKLEALDPRIGGPFVEVWEYGLKIHTPSPSDPTAELGFTDPKAYVAQRTEEETKLSREVLMALPTELPPIEDLVFPEAVAEYEKLHSDVKEMFWDQVRIKYAYGIAVGKGDLSSAHRQPGCAGSPPCMRPPRRVR